ncbi:hypothetical protein [Mycoplasma suis]|uniref:Uncharacterized protein n=1 Tax=Mycoplasma suis (strain Illinois) TaxID=768700 RepID=F0QQ48_MYCSL|nr:hypothetical protein [Mycoplasma suis]ADX97618.1 hypothetical protein MSU_0074 [Mycoplasma suis str. Illinois]
MQKKLLTLVNQFLGKGDEAPFPELTINSIDWTRDYTSSVLAERKWIIKSLQNDFNTSEEESEFFKNEKYWSESKVKKLYQLSNFPHLLENSYFYRRPKSSGLLFLDHLHYHDKELEKSIHKSHLSFLDRFESDSSFIDFENSNSYSQLINFEDFKEEKEDKRKQVQKENLFSELVKLNLSRECEDLAKKISEMSTSIISSSLKREVQQFKPKKWKNWATTTSLIPRKMVSLDTSIPHLFLKNFLQTGLTPVESSLIPVGVLTRNFVKFTERFSVLRHISKEEVDKKMEGARGLNVHKDYVQWVDPEEKWFYTFLPLLNLYFDRFRERYVHTSITTWEEPEGFLSLADVETGDSLSFSEDYRRPVFLYEGIPPLTIGEDLHTIGNLIDSYEKESQEINKKELEEGGLAISSSSIDLDNCLKWIKQEMVD